MQNAFFLGDTEHKISMKLFWDGLQLQLVHAMEPATLDRGFIRLVGPDLPTVSLRFGTERSRFHAKKDGARLLRATGLPQEELRRYQEPWANTLAGTLHASSRLYVFQFGESRGIIAAHFSTPPPAALVEDVFSSLAWSPPVAWRNWACYDIRFETPPDCLLDKAVFQPGRFHLTFRGGRNQLIFDRLAPADVLLDNMDLSTWCSRYFHRDAGGTGVSIHPRGETEIDIVRHPSLLARALPWLPWSGQPLRGKIRHIVDANKILILTELGAAAPADVSRRIHGSYATIP